MGYFTWREKEAQLTWSYLSDVAGGWAYQIAMPTHMLTTNTRAGKFRDVVRNFIKGTDGPWAGDFASAICGSPNIYANNTPHETDW